MRVVLGNRHAVVVDPTAEEGGAKRRLPRGKRATVIDFDEATSLSEAFTNVTHPTRGVWAFHADDGAAPAWVASDSPAMAAMLSEHFGGLEVRELEDPYGGE